MKKLLICFAALLVCVSGLCQETDDSANYAELTITPRLDIAPSYVTDGKSLGFSHGNSSIYTLFEGSHKFLSWTLANHWISTGGDYGWPYTGLTYSNTTNWLDYLLLDFSLNDNWTISAGKDMITTGGIEFDEWDWDVHTAFASPLWNNMACYQWGAKVSFLSSNEMHNVSLQATTSPFGERPFASGLFTYSAQYKFESDVYTAFASVSALQYDKAAFTPLISIGQQAYTGNWTFTLDLADYFGNPEYVQYNSGLWSQASVCYAFNDKFDLAAKASYSTDFQKNILADYWNAGAIFHWYPLKNRDSLRVHAYVNYDSFYEEVMLNIGARFNLKLNLW